MKKEVPVSELGINIAIDGYESRLSLAYYDNKYADTDW